MKEGTPKNIHTDKPSPKLKVTIDTDLKPGIGYHVAVDAKMGTTDIHSPFHPKTTPRLIAEHYQHLLYILQNAPQRDKDTIQIVEELIKYFHSQGENK